MNFGFVSKSKVNQKEKRNLYFSFLLQKWGKLRSVLLHNFIKHIFSYYMKSVEAKNGKEVAAKKTTPFLINVIAQRREKERKQAPETGASSSTAWWVKKGLIYGLLAPKKLAYIQKEKDSVSHMDCCKSESILWPLFSLDGYYLSFQIFETNMRVHYELTTQPSFTFVEIHMRRSVCTINVSMYITCIHSTRYRLLWHGESW